MDRQHVVLLVDVTACLFHELNVRPACFPVSSVDDHMSLRTAHHIIHTYDTIIMCVFRVEPETAAHFYRIVFDFAQIHRCVQLYRYGTRKRTDLPCMGMSTCSFCLSLRPINSVTVLGMLVRFNGWGAGGGEWYPPPSSIMSGV